MSVIRPKPPEDPVAYEPGASWAAAIAALLADRDTAPDHERMRVLGQGIGGLPERMLADYNATGRRAQSGLSAILRAAAGMRDSVDRVIVLGSDAGVLAARAIFEACAHPLHNELSRGERGGRPRLLFLGPELDPDLLAGALDLVDPPGGARGGDLLDRWGLVIVDHDPEEGTAAAAARLFLDALDRSVGGDATRLAERTLAIAGRDGWLARLAVAGGFATVPAVPEEAAGAAAFTAAGLLPAAIAGIDVVRLLEGAAALARRCREAPAPANPVMQCAAVSLFAARGPSPAHVMLASRAPHLEGVCRWHRRLVEGSACAAVHAPRSTDGMLRCLVIHLEVAAPRRDRLATPPLPRCLAGASGHEARSDGGLRAAAPGVENRFPAILLPRVDEHSLGQLLHLLVAATCIAGGGNVQGVVREEPPERL